MKISEIITDKYKLRIEPNVYYDLLADVREAEEEQEPICPSAGVDCEDCPAYEDAISRKAALDAIEDDARCGVYSHFASYDDAQAFKNYIKDLPSVSSSEKPNKWIPVSERLPEGADYCLCCDKDGHMAIGRMSNWSSYWCFDDDNTDIDVIAWMPLPEPYKAEGSDT